MLEPLLIAALLLGQTEVEAREGNPAIVSLGDYVFTQTSRGDVASGRTRVSIELGAPSPSSGSMPLRFFVDNTLGPRGAVTFTMRGNVGGRTQLAERTVEINAGERRVVNLPVPAELRYGTVSASGAGITESSGTSAYFTQTYGQQRAVLSLSRPEDFERYVGRPPRYSNANVMVHAIAPEEAPGELAAYVGYDAVVVPDPETFDTRLDESQRNALEAYLATGGHLLIGGPVRNRAVLPLLPDQSLSLSSEYGHGLLVQGAAAGLSERVAFREQLPVSPHGPLFSYERRAGAADLLLPEATAPLGRFLFIIALFTLAIGPGSVWIARKRGPSALLVSIPGTAFVTCALIIGYSLVADGFTVHEAAYSYTLLDARQHRAITLGVTGWYANLAPSKTRLSAGAVPIAPWDDRRDRYAADFHWGDGLTLGSDFVPSRTYREWGFLSVEPTRARLVLAPRDGGWVVQNAMGFELDEVAVQIEGKRLVAAHVAEGGEAKLGPGLLDASATPAGDRFLQRNVDLVVERPLAEREFLAHVRHGTAFLPTGGVNVQLGGTEHWIRGETER